MKNRFALASFLLLSLFTSPLFSQENDFISDYLERLEQSRTYLLLVAEAMPEDQYEFRATPESMSFEEHLMHIAWAMDWHCQSLLGGRDARDWNTDTELKVASKTRQEMIATIDRTFTETITFIRQFDVREFNDELDYLGLNRTKRQILLLLADHISHHRGQMLVYLRLNGIQPPRYILYQ